MAFLGSKKPRPHVSAGGLWANNHTQGLFEAIDNLEIELKDIKFELADKKDAIRVARGRIENFQQQAWDLERERVSRRGLAGFCLPLARLGG